MLFFDFEVFAYDWLVVIINPDKQEKTVIINDRDKLENFYREHRQDIWSGYNVKHYDQYIMKAILLGLDPKRVSDWIIVKDKAGYLYTREFQKINLIIYDVMNSLDRGLKFFEGSMGNDIRESSVPFDIDRKLTTSELAEVVKYCTHDVEQTIEVFLKRIDDFQAQFGLIKMFNLPLADMNKTKVQLSASILEARKRGYNDEFEIDFPPTLKIKKEHEFILDWYKKVSHLTLQSVKEQWTELGMKEKDREKKMPRSAEELKKFIYSQSLTVDIAGVHHVFGWGGVHGARESYIGTGRFINMDVASLYPSLMIQYNLHSRSCNPQKFNDIVETRLKYKAEKNPLQAPLKIVINGTYGAMKDKNNPLYDPLQANRVCVYGQLLLLDLIEKLSQVAEIIQSNTDGVLIRMPDSSNYNEWFDTVDDIAYEWEERTGLTLEFDEYRKVFQKDVNNYVIVDAEGKYKSKGAYVKKLSNLDYDLAVVNEAIVNYLVKNHTIEKTILECKELKKFQLVKRVSKKYKTVLHGDRVLNEKCVRCFASQRKEDGGLFKIHATRGNIAKIEGTPERAFIVNGDINGMEIPPHLDKGWYIDLARERVRGFIGR